MCIYITTITVTVEQHGTMIVLFHRTMEAATLWLEGLLDSYVKPNPQDADFHQSILDLRMQEMTERLPEINRVFEGVQLEMAGSVLNNTKVGDSDEFDANVVIKLPFDEQLAALTFDQSSPGYALLQVPKVIVEDVHLDIFVERNNASYISADKFDLNLRMAIFKKLNSLNTQSISNEPHRETFTFDCDTSPQILVFKRNDGWEYVSQPKRFSLDLATCIQLPMSALKDHPTIPAAIKRIQGVFPDVKGENFVRLVPKTSPRFKNSEKPEDPNKKYGFGLSDWVLGFGGIENQILKKFDTPSKCLMLLKYMISNHKDLPLWSYYLKTLVVQMVIGKPDKDFWSDKNLFFAFKACLERLYRAVLLTDLHDTFDHRLKLLQISLIEKHSDSEEEGTWLGNLELRLRESSRKFLTVDLYKTMTQRLQYLTSELDNRMSNGSEDTIDLLKTDVFKIKRYGRLWTKEEIPFLKRLTKAPHNLRRSFEDEGTVLISTTGGRGGKSGNIDDIYDGMFLVARSELRERWNPAAKWQRYTDHNLEWEKFKENFSSSHFRSNMFTFRTKFYDEPIVEATCAWCGRKFTSNRHIFWECAQARVFWEEYLQHGHKGHFGNKAELEQVVMLQMNLEPCFEADRQETSLENHRKHLTLMAKSYLLVCQRTAVLPSHCEHWSQMSATRNFCSFEGSSMGGYKYHWMNCPLPPQKGRFFKSLTSNI